MAKMIPSVLSPEIKSNAEKRIFEWFRDDPVTADWIVLHSLGISNHNKVIHGETDFFVLAPYMGVFALEVKGGRVSRKDGVWCFTNRYGKTTTKARGPFDQAWDGAFSIVNDIKKKLDNNHKHLKNVFFGVGVMFPDIEYKTVGCDEEQWQVFDSNDGSSVGAFIKRLFQGSREKWIDVHGKDISFDRLPSEEDINYIASILRGDFDKAVAMSAQIRYSEEELINLTNEQYRCIDQLNDNKRCLITGGAGTGKTLIAIEEAKMAVADGMKVALFCFNRNLGIWFEKYFADAPKNLRPAYIGTFHKYMLNTIKSNGDTVPYISKDDDSTEFYERVIPKLAKQAVSSSQEKFEKIIVDEAQDLIKPDYLNVLDASLSGGLSRGRWIMLGDFSQQAIYNSSTTAEKMLEMLEDRTAFIRFKLTVNCRNTKKICDEITTVTGFEPPSDIWSKVEGLPVEYLTYSSSDEKKEKLIDVLHSLIENHVSARKITILSPVKREKSIVNEIDEFVIQDYRVYGKNELSFSTIQSFKGLENTIIILIDIESIADKNLMYVALSRARSALYVIESDKARNEYLKIQLGRFNNGR